MSRPEKNIDWDKVDQLLMEGCLGTEIAPYFDMHPDTFYRRVTEKYGMGFTDYCSEKRSIGDSLLRSKQFQKALKGDTTLLIWLGKQRLSQKEHHDQAAPNNDQILGNILAEVKSMKEKPLASLPETNPINPTGDAQV